MEIKTNLSYDKKDFLQFSFYGFWRIFPVVFFIYILVSTFIFSLISNEFSFFEILFGLFSGFVFVLFYGVLTYWRSGRIFKTSKLTNIENNVIINESGIHSISEISTSDLPYNKIYKVCESEYAFYVYISKVQAILIPKRFLNVSDDVTLLKSLFINHLDKKKLKLKK